MPLPDVALEAMTQFSMNALAHAMRKTRTVKPFRKPVKERVGLPPWDLSGLTIEVARIDVDMLIRRYLPDYRNSSSPSGPGTAPAAWKDSEWGHDGHGQPVPVGPLLTQLRLRCLVVLSRFAVSGTTSFSREDVDILAATDYDALAEEYLNNVARIVPMDHDLPAIGYALPLTKRVTKVETSLPRALAIISRTANGLFLAGHAPYLQDFDKQGPIRYALLAPRAAEE